MWTSIAHSLLMLKEVNIRFLLSKYIFLQTNLNLIGWTYKNVSSKLV